MLVSTVLHQVISYWGVLVLGHLGMDCCIFWQEPAITKDKYRKTEDRFYRVGEFQVLTYTTNCVPFIQLQKWDTYRPLHKYLKERVCVILQ